MTYDPNEHVHQQRDLVYKEIELLNKEKELATQAPEKMNPALWPIIGTVITAILTFGSTAFITALNSSTTLQIEQAKSNAAINMEKQKHEQSLILLAVNVSEESASTEEENKRAASRLEFFMNVGLIPENTKLRYLIRKNKVIAIAQEVESVARLLRQAGTDNSEIQESIQKWRDISVKKNEEYIENSRGLNKRIEKLEKDIEKDFKKSPK